MPTDRFTIDQSQRNVCTVMIPYSGNFQQDFLLTGDRHWDNPKSLWGLQRKHLREARRRRAGVIDIGDFFCAMQGKFDGRHVKKDVRKVHQQEDYLDSLVDTATNFFSPYAELFIVIGRGNHETAILKRHETKLTKRLVSALNERNNTEIYDGGYSGWVNFMFLNVETKEKTFKKLWYHHGHGGGGPVTKGTIQTNRHAVYLPDADIVVTGHIHETWILELPRVRCNDDGATNLDTQLHISLPTYKEEYGDGFDGWHVEGGKPPKPIGAVWLRFKKHGSKPIEFDPLRAR